MNTLRYWIVLRNGDDARLVKTRPHLQPNEVAVEVIVKVPQPPRIIGTVTIELPEPPPAFAEAVAVEYPDDEDVET